MPSKGLPSPRAPSWEESEDAGWDDARRDAPLGWAELEEVRNTSVSSEREGMVWEGGRERWVAFLGAVRELC